MIPVPRVIAEVRRLMLDEALEKPRHSDFEIRSVINMVLLDIRRIRPDAFIEALDDVPDTTTTDEIEIEAFFFSPITHLTTAYLQIQTSEYVKDGTTQNLMSLGMAMLRSA